MAIVTCVKRIFRSDKFGLTINKDYELVREDKWSYFIVDDNGVLFPYDKKNFIVKERDEWLVDAN